MRLEAVGLGFRYGNGPWVLRDFNLSVAKGERVGLVGPSGSGKSTLARLLAGYERPAEGAVRYGGQSLPEKGVCPVQLIHQHPEKAINPRWRMKQTLREAGMLRSRLLDALGIERQWLDRFPRELSGGELQRFCVARALFWGTRFLLADEISTMLDVITQAQIWGTVLSEAARRELGLVVITHNRHLAARVCDRMVDLRGE